MKIFFLRLFFLLLLVFLQLSFFNILFPWFRAPLFLLGVVACYALVKNFPGALFMTLPLTLLFDVASLGAVSWFSIYAVFFAYVNSFLLRRLLLEHTGVGLPLYALVAFGAALLYQSLHSWVTHEFSLTQTVAQAQFAPSSESLIFSLVMFLPVFFLMYSVVTHFEQHVEGLNLKQFRNVR